MPPIQGYEASVEAAKRALEAAQSALPRDIAQAVANAGWAAFLRDRHDVQALVDHIAEAVQQRDFVSRLHATADKARHHQPQRGRPPKMNQEAAQKATGHADVGANSNAATI
ncbi:DNA-binding protein [Bradyrhizobium sp. AZCC 2289]|uniref:DNA-binding protein n=1 Tax=Bradyrhizobium sp. AZCC 2289 TaxID=3117026 RepID=UPI002FF0C412